MGKGRKEGLPFPQTYILLTFTCAFSRSLRYTKGGSLDSRYGPSAATATGAFPVYLTTAAPAGPGSVATGAAMQVVPILTAAQALQPSAAIEGEKTDTSSRSGGW